MSLSLLSVNSCAYASCGLHFQSLYDLIAHIELTHIPAFEEERQKCSNTAEDGRHNIAPNLPLSAFQRVFPTPYRPQPCKPETIKVSFNHHRKRAAPGMPPIGTNAIQPAALSARKDEDANSETGNDDFDECCASDPEMRFRCHYVDCGKRYKNKPALKLHMRAVHSLSSNDDNSSSTTAESIVPPLTTSANSSPTKYAATRPHKCQQCSKRYKTIQGLQNHVAQAHQKPNGGSANSESVNPSPAVVAQLITQARAHGQQAAQQAAQQQTQQLAVQAQAAAERALLGNQHNNNSPSASPSRGPPLPVSVAPQNSQHFFPQNAPLPVRSIQVQSGRVNSQPSSPYPPGQTTGQMLQQQLHQQRRQQQQQLQQQQQQQQQQQYIQQSQTQSQTQSHTPHYQDQNQQNQFASQPPSQLQQQLQQPSQNYVNSSHHAQKSDHITSQQSGQLQQSHSAPNMQLSTQHQSIQYQQKNQQSYEYEHSQQSPQVSSSSNYSGPNSKQYAKSPSTLEGRHSQQSNITTAVPIKDATSTLD